MKKTLSVLLLCGSLLMTGCGDSRENFVFTGNNPVVVAPPVCQDDAYQTNQDQQLVVNAASGVLANDSPNGGTVTFSATSTGGGTVTGSNDGSFIYTPAANFNGTDTFTYTVTNSAGSATCTVTITVNAVVIDGFFVDSVNGSDTTGSFEDGNPFQTIQAAVAAAPTNADIIVRPGNYTGAVTLKDGQRLLGSGSGLVNAQGDVRPVLTGPVVLADGNTLDFLRIENSPDDSINGDGRDGATIANCEIVDSGGEGVQARPGTGNWTVSNNTITNCVGIGIALQTTGAGQMTALVNNNTIIGSGFDAISFESENTSQCRAQVHNNVMTGNQDNFTFEVIVTETAQFCLDLENNTNDDVYVLSNSDEGSMLNVEELVIGPPHSIPSNTGTVEIDSGAGFANPMPQMDGFCGFF